MGTEGVTLTFTEDAVEAMAAYAFQVNQSTQNIGARRLHTILEHLLEELSFESPDMKTGAVEVNAAYVKQRLDEVTKDEDLSKFIL
jgi:ATP-dependent HslUV protease ATP-binding subunit HslU